MSNIQYDRDGKHFFVVGSEKIEWLEIKRVVYAHHDLKIMIVWEGNRKKPVSNYRYDANSYEKALESEKNWNDRRVQEIKDYEQQCIDKCKAILENTKIGDVFYASWGFEQTNIDYYQVVAMKGKKFSFRKIKADCDYNAHYMTGKCVPLENEFVSEDIIEKSLSKYALFKIDSVRDIKPEPFEVVDGVKVYEKKFYSCYA